MKKNFYSLFFFIFFNSVIELIGLSALFPLISFVAKGVITTEIQRYIPIDVTDTKNIIFFLFLIILLLLFRLFFIVFTNHYSQKTIMNFSITLTSTLLNNYFNNNYLIQSNIHTSQAVKNILNEVDLYCKLLNSKIILFAEILMILLIVNILLFIQTKITLVCFAFIILIFLIYKKVFFLKIKKYGKIREDAQKNTIQTLLETLNNFKLIKIFKQENFFKRKFNLFQEQYKKTIHIIAFIQTLPKPIIEFLFFTLVILFIALNVIFFSKVDESTFNILTVFLISFYRIMPSTNKILHSLQSITFTKISEKIIIENLISNHAFDVNFKNYQNKKIEKPKNFFENEIKVKNLCFSYNEKEHTKFLINNLNFNIKKGEFIGISGSSGNGKTTLINILMKILDYSHGTIHVDNCELKNIEAEDWYSLISYVPQDVFVHNDTIIKNIIFGDIPYQKKLFEDIIELSNLKNFVYEKPFKEQTILNEKGSNISAGQIQRLGIARALYKKPQILFLDEPTSHLDFDNEITIVDTLKKLTPEITVIMISHKTSSLSKCDKIIQI